jgi:hypothetical protein
VKGFFMSENKEKFSNEELLRILRPISLWLNGKYNKNKSKDDYPLIDASSKLKSVVVALESAIKNSTDF